jgi:hypothetical protein
LLRGRQLTSFLAGFTPALPVSIAYEKNVEMILSQTTSGRRTPVVTTCKLFKRLLALINSRRALRQ